MNYISEREIRALSIKQPFAQLVAEHGKVETRTFRTSWRGLVLFCSSKERYGDAHVRNWCGNRLAAEIAGICPDQPQGMAIAIGNLVDCRPLSPNDAHFIQWSPGWAQLWGWHFENVTLIEPFAFKGQVGLPRVGDEAKRKIRLISNTL